MEAEDGQGMADGEVIEHLSDVGNGKRLVRHFGRKLRYVAPWKAWLDWDGKRWHRGHETRVEYFAKLTIRETYREAAGLTDDLKRQRLAEWAHKSESAPRIAAMITMARSEPAVAVEPHNLDTDPWLLNCPNGTIDLRTGEIRQHRRRDLITKLCPTPYRPNATCPTWLAFLDSIFPGDAAMIRYIQRLCGYWLTGDVREQILPICWGSGSNGKSTLLEMVAEMMGEDYAITADQSIIVAKERDRGGHTTEKMDLHGRRLALVSETDEGQRFAEGAVKQLTGGDTIRGRNCFEGTWQYRPTHKIVLCTNHKPRVKATDHAFWRRAKAIHFAVKIRDEDQDKLLKEKLRDEFPGMLVWAVQGGLDWQRDGLCEPESVRLATEEYRTAEDVIARFIHERCVEDKAAKVQLKQLRAHYADWCRENSEGMASGRVFGEYLGNAGYAKKLSNGTWYEGIGLATD